ncbi:hypothetical protein [Hymenobacter elongatus]|uniref:Uncharacterized protein n=1 Tax=Hymenobacter elongatus TaxID=877208 RepID=A0A4Z0PII2_9BACT|nr:hypothetical protein [Hymenobacter elongatus]TGE14899.1 hypothetical protein E5J99_14140 [Hymenobacter elongatus]
MRIDRSLWRTVLFSLAVVAFVIGVYQTLVENNPQVPMESLKRNYWLFMISFACTMGYRYMGRAEEPAAGSIPAAKPAARKKPKPSAGGKRKR